jgi:hypothetical protein
MSERPGSDVKRTRHCPPLACYSLAMSVVPSSPTLPPQSPLSMGDLAAADGMWMRALSHWTTTRDGPDRVEAERRIRWFLEEAARPGANVGLDARNQDTSLKLPLAGCGLGLIGTAIVLFGEGRDGAVQAAVSIAAWICIIAAAVLTVIWAWHSGRQSIPLTDADVTLALDLAATLDGTSQRNDSVPA